MGQRQYQRILAWEGWGPVLCLTLIFSGFIKGTVFLRWIPVDLTVLAGAAVIFLVVHESIRSGRRIRIRLWPLVLLATFLPGWRFILERDGYGLDKLVGMGVTVLAAIAPLYLVFAAERQRYWVKLIAGVGIALAFGLLVAPNDSNFWGGIALQGSNTIATAQLAGLAFILAFVGALAISDVRRYPLAVLCIGFAALVIATGSRGTLITAALTVIVALFVAPRKGRLVRIYVLGTVFVCGGLVLLLGGGAGATRILSALKGESDLFASRIGLWEASFRYISADPFGFGIGWGRFANALKPSELLDSGPRQYAHNVILEVWVEGGFLPAVAVVILIVASLWQLARNANSFYGSALLLITVFAVLNAMFTGDINDHRLLWASLTLAWVLDPRLALGKSELISANFRLDQREPLQWNSR